MATAKDILKIAAKEIGVKESPPGSNKVKYSKEYGMTGAWCAMFCWWVFKQAGASKLYYDGKKTAYTPTLWQFYKAKKQSSSSPKVGDMVFFNFGGRPKGTPEHVGFVEKVLSGGKIQTIEGNTGSGSQADGGQVQRRTRATSLVVGYARPKYTTGNAVEEKPASTSKPPKFPLPSGYVYGSQSGGNKVVSGCVKRGDGLTGAGLKQWQQRMKDRGWKLSADGQYGPETAKIARQFQAEKGLDVDGLIGPDTWAAAWNEPVT